MIEFAPIGRPVVRGRRPDAAGSREEGAVGALVLRRALLLATAAGILAIPGITILFSWSITMLPVPSKYCASASNSLQSCTSVTIKLFESD